MIYAKWTDGQDNKNSRTAMTLPFPRDGLGMRRLSDVSAVVPVHVCTKSVLVSGRTEKTHDDIHKKRVPSTNSQSGTG